MHHSSSKCKSFLFLKPIKLISHKNIKCNIINTINYNKPVCNVYINQRRMFGVSAIAEYCQKDLLLAHSFK